MTSLSDILREADAANRPPVESPPRDELGEALIAHKLVPNDFILDLNHGLTVPYDMEMPAPWNLPSRMFRFPIEVTEPPRRISLAHPLLVDHPFVRHVQETLGIVIDPQAAPQGFKANATWWHAVDLIGRWKDLLETERFTTPDCIAGAVDYGLSYSSHEGKKRDGHINTVDARKIMAHLGSQEPADKPGLMHQFMRPSQCESRWPINTASSATSFDKAWALIVGIETGWFKHDRSGHLQWTQAGRDKFTAVVGVPDVTPELPPAPKQEPAPVAKPATSKAMQLDLF